MPFLEFIAKGGLAFCHTPILVTVILLGLLSKYRAIFVRCTFLLLFTMIYNLLLKSHWQAPLPPPLEGWAFPSGHMHSAIVFWGWLAYEFHKLWFYEIVFFILVLVGYGLVHEGYHYPIDLAGSVGFGALSLFIYAQINRLSFFKDHLERLGLLMVMLGFSVFMILPPQSRKPHVKIALIVLICCWLCTMLGALLKKHYPKLKAIS